MMKKKGQSGFVGALIGLMIAIIVGVAAAIPVTQDVINDANLSGTTAVIVNLIPLMIGLVLFVAVASLVSSRA